MMIEKRNIINRNFKVKKIALLLVAIFTSSLLIFGTSIAAMESSVQDNAEQESSALENAEQNSAYWHDSNLNLDNSDWMSRVSDDKLISELSIPGTHDTMAYNPDLKFLNITRTQTISLENQLNSGIRYLDIRLTYQNDRFDINHGAIYLGYNFTDVLETVEEFLSVNPSETIVMRLKQEHSKSSLAEMKNLFDKYFEEYRDLFWTKDSSNSPSNPSLAELRGKILVVSEVDSIDFSLRFKDIILQDYFALGTVSNITDKWDKVRNHLELSNQDYSNNIYMNHLSATGGAMPYTVASGQIIPDNNTEKLWTGIIRSTKADVDYPYFSKKEILPELNAFYYRGINELFVDFIQNNYIENKTGIVIADFPGAALINSIIEVNFK